jgi:signal transduction histidine kinase
MRKNRSSLRLAEILLILSLPAVFLLLILARPPTPYYAFLLAPVVFVAALHELAGGILAALAALVAGSLLIALDPVPVRQAGAIQDVWPIFAMYLVVGPAVGWLASIERERARTQTTTAVRLRVVQEIARAVSRSLDLEETLRTILAEISRLVSFDRAVVVLPREGKLEVVAVSQIDGPQAVGLSFPLEGSATGWAIKHRQIWVGDIRQTKQYPDTRRLCPETLDCLILPLQLKRRVIGALLLGGIAKEEVSTSEMESLDDILGHIAIAIENARLFELERERARHLAAISEASQEIATPLDLDRTLHLVMSKAVETLPMDAGALFQYDAGTQAYRVVVSHNLSPEHVKKITFAFDEGVPGWVVSHRQSLVVADAWRDPRVHPHVIQDGIRSVLAVPMLARERVVGVLNLYQKSRTHVFNRSAVQLAEVYASQAAVAIENVHLVDELRSAALNLEARVEERTRQLRETQSQIIRSEKLAAIGRLAGSVAHEVNNPLQAIALHLELLTEEGNDVHAQDRLDTLKGEVAHIAGIVQRLLEFQRPGSGVRAPHDIRPLLDDVLSLAEKQLQRSDIEVVWEPGQTPARVFSDGGQLQQVFLNLILNAMEAMPDGGRLTIQQEQQGGNIQIHFTDTGTGMTDEVLGHLFEPFFSTKDEGTGLGLAISHEIIDQHAGSLDATSEVGKGSCFTVSIPLLHTIVDKRRPA